MRKRYIAAISLIVAITLTGCAGAGTVIACPPLTIADIDRSLVSGDSTAVPALMGSTGSWPAGGCVYESANVDDTVTYNVVYYDAGPTVLDELSAWANSVSLSEQAIGNARTWSSSGLTLVVRAFALDDSSASQFNLSSGDVIALFLVNAP